MLNSLLLARRLLWRELRKGQWLIIFLALLLAVIVITGMRFYTDRLTRGLENQSVRLLGGNLVVSSSMPLPKQWDEKAKNFGLRTAHVWSYPSVVSTASKLQLVNIQAVSNNYPLFANKPIALKSNTVWVEPRLLTLLNISVEKEISIGAAKFHVSNKISNNLEMVNSGWVIAPRILIRLDDVSKTQTVLPGSRVDYRLLIAGDEKNLKAFRQWISLQLKPGQNLLDISNQQFVLRDTLIHAKNYIQLILLLCLLMSGVAIGLSVRQYLKNHYAQVALWRCLGASAQQITFLFIWQLLFIALAAGVLGILIGYLLQGMFAVFFKDFFQFPLPAITTEPIILGFVTSILLLFSYAFPIVRELPKISPLYIWRYEITETPLQRPVAIIIAILFLLIYIDWEMNFSLLALFFLDMLLLSIGFLYAFYLITLKWLRKIMNISQGTLRRGLAEMVLHPESTSVQLTAFTLIVMSLMLLSILRNDLIKHWQSTFLINAPNYFAFNIGPTDIQNVEGFFKTRKISIDGIYPMVRGRLIALNGRPIMQAVPLKARSHNALHRELNLSAMLVYPSDNKIILGQTWTNKEIGKNILSVATNISDDLQLKLKDKLTFQIGDQQVSATISNIRTLEWTSFHPNFYVIFPPGVIDHFPTTYITSFYLKSNQISILNQLIQQFPNITVIDIASALQQIQAIVDKMILSLRYLFYFALGSGLLIFIACFQASQDERRQTYYLLHILGASKKYIYKSLIIEFSFLAILVIIYSSLLAYSLSYLLLKTFFSL